MSGNRRRCDITEPVESVLGAHPNISFAIFEDRSYVIGRETSGCVECIGPALMQVQQALPTADPQTTVAAPRKPGRRKLARGVRKRISVNSSIHELLKSVKRT